MGKFCVKCQQELDDDTLFCPTCGTKCPDSHPWFCTACGQENSADAKFCKSCGAGLAEQLTAATTTMANTQYYAVPAKNDNAFTKFTNWLHTYPYAKAIIGTAVASIIFMIGAYLYFMFTSESQYVNSYAEASRKITDVNDILTSNITPDKLKSDPVDVTQQLIQQQKAEIEKLQKRFESKKSPDKYTEQHKNMLEFLQLETSILQQTGLILANPLNTETDNVLKTLKGNIEDAKGLTSKMQVADTTVSLSSEMTVLPNKLTIFVEEKRKANKEKMDRLAAMNEFFKKMDAIIQRYNSAKTDLGGLLENLRKGGYTWNDYFAALYQAKTLRTSLRSQVTNLPAPKGTEGLKTQFTGVLNDSVNYCDLMYAAANVEYSTNYNFAQQRYKAAAAVNDNVQKGYSSFSSNYQAEKTRLTNIDNL